MDWYKKTYLEKYLTADADNSDAPFVQAQILLSEVAKNIPNGHVLKGKSYIVGGTVRDEMLGIIPKDIDAVIEYPDGGLVFGDYVTSILGLKPPIDKGYGVYAVILKDLIYKGQTYNVDGIEIEAVQTRKEQYRTGSRKPEVAFGTLQDDVMRRDFTVNSLLKKMEAGPVISPDVLAEKISNGDIVDLTGMGLKDIEDGIIRTPSDPNPIFEDDALRMLRGVRFAVKHGWTMTDEVKEAIRNNIHNLSNTSAERFRGEIDKIAGYGKMHEAIPLMEELDLLEPILPEMHALIGVEQDTVHHSEGDAYVHTLKVIEALENENPDAGIHLTWAAISHDWGKAVTQERVDDRIHFYKHEKHSGDMIKERMKALKYPNDVVDKTVKLVDNHMRGHSAGEWGDKAFRRYYRDMDDAFDDVLALLVADEVSSIPAEGELKNNSALIKNRMPELMMEKLPEKGKDIIDGHEIMNMLRARVPDIKPGRHIGIIKEVQEDIILDNPSLIDEDLEVTKANVRSALEADPRFQEVVQSLVSSQV
jgi:tRNA nucleotidyltransferase/poly(A) polymerase